MNATKKTKTRRDLHKGLNYVHRLLKPILFFPSNAKFWVCIKILQFMKIEFSPIEIHWQAFEVFLKQSVSLYESSITTNLQSKLTNVPLMDLSR